MTRSFWTAAFIAGATAVAPVRAHAEQAVTFNIPPQSLEGALLTLARQADVSLALPTEGLEGAHSEGLIGRHSPREALGLLLAGTGYTFETAGDRAYRVTAVSRARQFVVSDEIIVTAARSSSPLRNLPRALSDVPGQRLEELGAADSHALAGEVSGLAFTDLGIGRDKIYMRGISDGAISGRAQSTVGIYLDGIRLTYAAPDPQLALVDVARVDVLRGPQGALYGAGSIGGVLSVETNAPNLRDFQASSAVGLNAVDGGGAGHDAELILNAPLLADRLAVRLAAYDEKSPGWLNNAALGRSNTNNARRSGERISVQWAISPNWSARAFYAEQAIDSRDSQYQAEGAHTSERPASMLEPHDNDFSLAGVLLHADTDFAVVDTSTAHVRHDISSRYDANGFALLGVNPAVSRPMDERAELDIAVHETRIASPTGARLPWFLGFFYADGDNVSERSLRDGAAGVWANLAYTEHRTDAIDEMALFGQTTWRLTPSLSLMTGARVFRFDVKTTADVAEPLLGLTEHVERRMTDHGVAPDIRLALQASPDLLLFLSAAEGYRSGGFNTGQPVGTTLGGATQPFAVYAGDELWTYEAGMRATALNGRLHLSATAFFNDWRRIQTDGLIVNGLPFTANVGSGRAFGVESDLTYSANDNLTFRGHLLVNEPEVNWRDPSFPGAAGTFPGAAEISASAGAIYEREMSPFGYGGRARVELDTAFVGVAPLAFDGNAQRHAYTQTNLLFGYSAGRTDFTAYLDNVFDAAGQTFSSGNPYSVSGPFVTLLRPRTFGLRIRRRL